MKLRRWVQITGEQVAAYLGFTYHQEIADGGFLVVTLTDGRDAPASVRAASQPPAN